MLGVITTRVLKFYTEQCKNKQQADSSTHPSPPSNKRSSKYDGKQGQQANYSSPSLAQIQTDAPSSTPADSVSETYDRSMAELQAAASSESRATNPKKVSKGLKTLKNYTKVTKREIAGLDLGAITLAGRKRGRKGQHTYQADWESDDSEDDDCYSEVKSKIDIEDKHNQAKDLIKTYDDLAKEF